MRVSSSMSRLFWINLTISGIPPLSRADCSSEISLSPITSYPCWTSERGLYTKRRKKNMGTLEQRRKPSSIYLMKVSRKKRK
ncbi:hypothetical protein XELAEV_18003962mg [Xenopus laevis]|uniref:Secreted protein n=1 Tax=Xenopus laevis TaxID=8355 RepID=A0A974BRZ8_XENLA|nr:hypothetical protein XELAEV_18003962mg [Xenopus laevis]